MKKKISFVIPCYKSSQTLEKVVEEIKETMINLSQYSYEIILVNDCSPDNTFEVIEKLCKVNKNICGILYFDVNFNAVVGVNFTVAL